MDQNHAGQIATLLNTRNQLVKNYDANPRTISQKPFDFRREGSIGSAMNGADW